MVSELKEMIHEELAGRYVAGIDYIVVGYTGLKAQESTELRRKLRQGNVRMEVIKNSIAKRVFETNGLSPGTQFIDGPSALVTGTVEMPALCKLLRDLSKEYEDKLTIRGGMFDGAPIDGAGVRRLAGIPPLPVLQSQIIGSIYGQLAGVASAFQSISRSLAYALEGIRQQLQDQAG